MKTLILLFCLAVLAYGQETYDSELDDFDLSEVLKNDRLLVAYSNCLLDKGPCTPEVKKLKEKLPEALKTRCAKCTDKQKRLGKQVVAEIRSKHPKIWSDLASHYDPQGKYMQDFQEFLRS